MTSVIALVMAIAKALPAAERLFSGLADAWQKHIRETQRKADHALIDADREKITSSPWICPRTCPYKFLHDSSEATKSNPTSSGTPGIL